MKAIAIPVKQLDDDLPLPSYAYVGDAGLDLRTTQNIELPPFGRMLVPCGIALALPSGYAGFVMPRSGLAVKHGVSIVNSPGLIDSNYRGEIKALLVNLDPRETFRASRGDRIAQLVIARVETASFVNSLELPSSERGKGGFGSSDAFLGSSDARRA